jgi:hypothetical protein
MKIKYQVSFDVELALQFQREFDPEYGHQNINQVEAGRANCSSKLCI